MATRKLFIFYCLTIATMAQGKPYGDDNNDLYANDDYEDVDTTDSGRVHSPEHVIHELPKFVTTPQNIMINQGATLKLPCLVNRLEGFVLLWKKGEDIIVVGKQLINRNDQRMQLIEEVNGNTLVISLTEEEDAGNYTCQVSTYKPTELRHSVKVRVKPDVRPVPDNGVIVAEEHDSVTLACEIIQGYPTPEVIWSRKERKMPGGEEHIRGLTVTFTSVTRHHSGHYMCSADNGFGQPSVANIKLDVQHAPEIEQEEAYIHTSEGDETEVICTVHSSPKSEVTWYKDGLPLQPTTHIINQRGNKHTLTIPGVDRSHFGTYSCKATNQYGEDKKSTVVTGKAEPAYIKSDPKGLEYDRFGLEWEAKSLSPISKFMIQFKGSNDDKWMEDEVDAYPVPESDHMFTGTYMVTGLSPASVYMAKISSHNDYGFSDPSQMFQFATRGADPIQKPMTGGNGSMTKVASLGVIVICSILSTIN